METRTIFETPSDLAAADPAYVPASSALHLDDRYLMAVFERVCTQTGVTRWTCPQAKSHFDVCAEDVRVAVRKLLYQAGGTMDLQHALRVIAWGWEREAMTSC